MALVPTHMRLPEELKAQAQHEAKRLGVSFSEYIREAIVFRLAWDYAWRSGRPEPALDAARRLLNDPSIWPENDETPGTRPGVDRPSRETGAQT